MEPAATVPLDHQPIWDAINGFLKTAVLAHGVAHTVHVANSPAPVVVDQDMEELAGTVSLALISMIKLFKEPTTTAGNADALRLMHSCVKIGQGLAVQFTRARPSFLDTDPPQVDRKQFCTLWPAEHVVTLHQRLCEIIQQCRELQPLSNDSAQLPDLLEFSKLALSDVAKTGSDSAETLNGPPQNKAEEADIEIATSFDRSNYQRKPPGQKLAAAPLINDFLLESLAYKSMYDREEEVTEAHRKTLRWIFNNADVSDAHRKHFSAEFTTWLRTTELGPIYWITGKPGSGKSTLMGFLSQNRQAEEHLRQWANGRAICTAGFFFWTSGTRDQRSQTGLLRSLLHQLLSENHDLISSTFPTLWQTLRKMTTKERINFALDWTVFDLMDAFHLLLDEALPTMNICLFIDGLDEFDGDHGGIVDFFKSLSQRSSGQNLKMCLSSRPWAAFAEAFQNSVPNGRLQDLTHDDMYRYTEYELKRNPQIRELLKGSADSAHGFVESAVQRADGVFLWVRLAVERMLRLVKQTDDMDSVKKLLESFPGELDEFFQKLIFQDQSAAHIADTAQLFQLMCARENVADFLKDESSTSLTIWELAFALNIEDDDLALKRAVEEATIDEIASRYDAAAIHVQSRFSGLLTLHRRRRMGNLRVPKFVDQTDRKEIELNFVHDKVTYIHRTVRDWLMNPDGAFNRLNELSNPEFDPHLRLLRSYLLRLKHPIEEIEHHRRLDEWYPDIALAMSHARYISKDPNSLQRSFVNEMNSALSWYWLSKPSDPLDHWARSTFGAYEIRAKAPPIRHPFLYLAAKFGLTTYIIRELQAYDSEKDKGTEDEDVDAKEPTPLLSYAIEFLCSRNKTIFPLSDPRLIEFLLKNPSKINPEANHKYADFFTHASRTPWLALLRHLRDAHRRGWIVYNDTDPEGTERWAKVVRLFIEVGGADVNAVVAADSWDPEITAVGVLELVKDASGNEEVGKIEALMKQMKQNN